MKDEIKEIINDLLFTTTLPNVSVKLNKEKLCQLKDYITNLQEENERLKQPQIFIDTMDMEERYGQELYEDYLKEQLEDYKQRNEKAREMIKFIAYNSERPLTTTELNKVYNILGGDKDE